MISTPKIELREVERLFQAALKLAPEERKRFLARECGDDAALRREVEELLDTAAGRGPLDRTVQRAIDVAMLPEAAALRVPEQIGQYKILSILASGGMGTVYEAEQEQPRRTVAVKVLRWELSSREALRRFDYESQLLARLVHPGIAQVYDAGVHDEEGLRLPYFAMELIPDARPITKYAAEKELELQERLELFARVCDAVEHGHQQGVIHRDLKPSNLLVGTDGRPRIIDFGVARSTDADVTLASMQTATGELVGTLQYMSPEQCAGGTEPIDTRSDVYSLGVVLFELLSGQLPYDLSGKNVYEGTRTIIESSPSRLGTIDRQLRGEVETIVHKGLEKEPARRYGSAGELAADIRRYLTGEAIAAQPPSVAYHLRVIARRNKTLVAAAACVLVVLVAGLVSTGAALVKADRALYTSQSLSTELSSALSVAMETISSVDPTAAEISYGDEPTTEELLDQVATLLDNEFAFPENSLNEAELRLKLGRAYRHIGRFDDAQRHLERAMTIRHAVLGIDEKVAECLRELFFVYRQLGIHQDESDAAIQIIDWYESGHLPVCLPVGIAYQERGWQLFRQREFAKSVETHNRALEILGEVEGPKSRQIAWCLNNRGVVYGDWGKLEQARDDYRSALEMRLDVLGPDHSHTIHNYINLAQNAKYRGELDEALEWVQKGWDGVLRHRAIGKNHLYYRFALEQFADVLYQREEYERAEPLLRELISYWDRQRLLPLSGRWQLGMCLLNLGKYEESEELLLAHYKDAPERAQSLKRPSDAAKACEGLILLYDTWGKPNKVAEWRGRLEEIQAQRSEPAIGVAEAR